MFHPVCHVVAQVGMSDNMLFGRDRQVAAPGGKSAVSDCILCVSVNELSPEEHKINTASMLYYSLQHNYDVIAMMLGLQADVVMQRTNVLPSLK